MALSETRRKMRFLSFLNAGQMIEDLHEGGMTPDEMGMTEKEFEIFIQENKRTAKFIFKLAMKYHKEEFFDET